MGDKLALVTSEVGATFINHHVVDIAPERTVVVALYTGHRLRGYWQRRTIPLATYGIPHKSDLKLGWPESSLQPC